MSFSTNSLRRRKLLAHALVLGFVGWLIPTLGNGAAAFVTDWAGSSAWIAGPAVGVLASVGSVLATVTAERRVPLPDEHGASPKYRPPPRSGSSVAVALLSVLLIVGAGGWAAAKGVQYAVGWFTGDEVGLERLIASPPSQSRGLTLKVLSVEETAHFTRVKLSVTNAVGNTVKLPLLNNCILASGTETTLQADPSKSDWADTIVTGPSQTGTITFPGHLSPVALTAALRFGTVFEQGFNGPKSISVPNLRLRAAAG